LASWRQRLNAGAGLLVRVAVLSVWPGAIAVALGATLYALTNYEHFAAMLDNVLSVEERRTALYYFLGAAAAVALVYVVVLAVRFSRAGRVTLADARRIAPYLSFVLSGPAIIALTEPRIEVSHELRAWTYIACVVAAWWPTLHALAARSPGGISVGLRLSDRQKDTIAMGLSLVLWASYVFIFVRIAIVNHHSLNTRLVDLGLYDNIFFNSSHGDPLGCSFLRGGNHAAAHFDPILVILSPLYRLYPRAEFLLVLQVVWCGAGIVGTYLLGRRQLDSRVWGLVFALVYALHPALHGANLYEFHSLTLLIAPLMFALHFLFAGKLTAYFVTLALLLLIREDVSLLMCFVGAYALLSGEPRLERVGWATILASIAYFLVAKFVFMSTPEIFNEGEGAYGFGYYYKEMMAGDKNGFSFLTTLLTNPAYVVAVATKKAKLLYMLLIFAPMLFTPAWAGRARLMLVYGFVFILLASRSAVYSPHFQYSAVLLPVAIGIAPLGVRALRQRRSSDRGFSGALLGSVLIAALLVSWKFGAIVPNDSFRAGFLRVARTWDDTAAQRYEGFRELISVIDQEDSVSATDRVGSHVSNRARAYKVSQKIESDWVLVEARDMKGRDKKIIDQRVKDGKLEVAKRSGRVTLYRAVLVPKELKDPKDAKGPKDPKELSDPKKPKANPDEKGTGEPEPTAPKP
jgi:uncharacterized membrane protein